MIKEGSKIIGGSFENFKFRELKFTKEYLNSNNNFELL